MRVVITGFEPFGEVSVNPSAQLVAALSDDSFGAPIELTTEVLRTEYDFADDRAHSLLADLRPDLFISLGVAQRADRIRLETTAVNRDASVAPDNAGSVRVDEVIESHGPDAYLATLPLHEIGTALAEASIDFEFSDDAGNYVCNHLFYKTRHLTESLQLTTRSGFVHVPLCKRDSDFENLLTAVTLIAKAAIDAQTTSAEFTRFA